ncbi:MAG TPA: GNAT family N-acetyltransferase [Candidatus Polarisedimenticolia bacterium]|jgi:hypothetical protein
MAEAEEGPDFTLEVATTPEAVQALRDDWRRLDAETSVPVLFRTWEWTEAWLHAVQWSRRLHVIVVRDADKRVVAIAPLMVGARGAFDRGARILSFIGSDGPQGGSYLDLIAAPGWEGKAHLAVARHLAGRAREFSYINLNRVAVDDPGFSHWTAAALECGLRATVDLRRRTVWSPLPSSHDEYIAAVPNKRWRQRMRNYLPALLKEFPTARFVDRAAEDPLEPMLADLRRLQQARWGEEKGTYWERPGFDLYMGRLCAAMKGAGKLRAIFLMIDARPVAARLGLVHRGTWIDFQAGRDPAFTGHEVSYITLWHCAERAIGEGLARMDSLDEYEYKRRYFRETRWLADLRLYDERPSSAARQIWRAAKGSARAALRDLLPERLRARLRS